MTARVTAWRRWLVAGLVCLGLGDATPAWAQAEAVDYYGVDAVGSIRVVFRPDGTVVARADYLPFGEAAESTTGQLPATQFTGQERDPEAAQDCFHARYYQPRHGRFGSVDPIFGNLFDPQQLNRYAYANNSPLVFVDPEGRNLEGPRPDFYTLTHGGFGLQGVYTVSTSAWSTFVTLNWLSFGPPIATGQTGTFNLFRADDGVSDGSGTDQTATTTTTTTTSSTTTTSGAPPVVGGTVAEQSAVENARNKFFDKLYDTPDCLAYFGPDPSRLERIGIQIVPPPFSKSQTAREQSILRNTVGATQKGGPISIYGGGPFFTPPASSLQRLGTSREWFQASGLAHEYAHAAGPLPLNDLGDPERSWANHMKVWNACFR